jgi:hypothetical protein
MQGIRAPCNIRIYASKFILMLFSAKSRIHALYSSQLRQLIPRRLLGYRKSRTSRFRYLSGCVIRLPRVPLT